MFQTHLYFLCSCPGMNHFSLGALVSFIGEWCLDVKKKLIIVFLDTAHNTLNTSMLQTPKVGRFFYASGILCHQVGVLRLNSILTRSTWEWCQILQVKGLILQDRLPPHFHPQPQVQIVPCAADQLAIDWKFP